MVNCAAITNRGAISDPDPDLDGAYEVLIEDLRIVDLYLPGPAGHFCDSETAACPVDESRETLLYVEAIEDQSELVTGTYTAHLVR